MGKIVVGIQMYTLREFCKTKEDAIKSLEKVSKIGYRVVQISGMVRIDPKELRKILDDNGLKACSSHIGYNEVVNETDRVIEEHNILGCESMVCPGLPGEYHCKDGYKKVAKTFSKIIPKIKKNKLTLGYHNHSGEFKRYGDKVGLEILFENCPELEAEIDTYWVQHGGGDPAQWIEKYPKRINGIHVKDMGIIDHKQVMPPIGEGNLNWERIIKACHKSGVKYGLVEMDETTIDPFEAVKISFKNLLNLGMKQS